ncbi:phiRv2 prophage protein [Mycobacteroides abscessus]|uniref:DUF2742 domain-containing protein n=1 Tax=Mycobacteroides abscessus TaxID=36809 RepID=UPI0005E30736|nr:DUF2742 domain-containing protein [Mycobacteroides abscessus]CQA07539.1 phiRv2 prophage protein [Mycobacteroides abscessus]
MTDDFTSKQVDWWAVHEFVQPRRQEVGCWPQAGTPAWQLLDPTDPAKLAAVLDAARHHALRMDTEQASRAQASQDISRAADWSAIASAIRNGRGDAYIPMNKEIA